MTLVHSPSGEQVGASWTITSRIRFGRAPSDEVDVVVDDHKISRCHATFARAGLVVSLRDEKSSNGTFVNGRPVEHGASVVLRPDDIVRMGGTLFHLALGTLPAGPTDPALLGRARAFLEAVARAERFAASAVPVLILGETGTGKDVLARYLHRKSGRSGEYVAVNCATLPQDLAEAALFGHRKGAFTGATTDQVGFFAQAERGTLFLDEIGELPLHQQPKLLRVLENHELVPVGSSKAVHVDVRVVAATHVDLPARAQSGAFREDLYARLAGAVIRLPPLAARRGDILDLARRFLAAQAPAARYRFSHHVAEALLLHAWPHNVRELRSAMQRLALLHPGGGDVTRGALGEILGEPAAPAKERADSPTRRGAGPARKELVERLTELRGNVNRIAEHYGKDPKQVYRWLKRHGLDPQDFR